MTFFGGFVDVWNIPEDIVLDKMYISVIYNIPRQGKYILACENFRTENELEALGYMALTQL